MRKTNLLLILIFLVFAFNFSYAEVLIVNHYEENNIGYVDDPSYNIEVNPLHSYGSAETENYVFFKIKTKVDTDLYNLGWGFNTANTYPEKAELKTTTPTDITETKTIEINETVSIEATTDACDIGNEKYNTQKYKVTYQDGIKTLCFNSYTQNNTDYTITYTDYYVQDYSWLDISEMFISEDIEFNNKNKFYFLNGVAFNKDQEYELRIKLKILDNGKFDFLYYPTSYNTVYDAYNDNAIFYIDPTYNTTSMVAYWNLDQNTNDSISTNDNATGFNITYASNTFANYNAVFNANSRIQLGVNKYESENGTWAMWFKANETNPSYKYLLSLQACEFFINGNNSPATQLGVISFNIYDGAWRSITANNTFNNNQWHFLVGTWNKSENMRLYIDGNLIGTRSVGTLDTSFSTNTHLGSYWNPTTQYFYNGSIDEVMYWTRALPQSEITTLYNSYNSSSTPISFNVTSVSISTGTNFQYNTYNNLIGSCKAENSNLSNISYNYVWYKSGTLFKNETTSANYTQNVTLNLYNLSISEYNPEDIIILSCRAYSNTTGNYTPYVNSTPFLANNTFYTTTNKVYYKLLDSYSDNISFSLNPYCLNITCNDNTNCTTLLGASSTSLCYNISNISVDNKILYEGVSDLNCYADFNIGQVNPVGFNFYWFNNTNTLLKSGTKSCEIGSQCTLDTITAGEIGTNNGIYCGANVSIYQDTFFNISLLDPYTSSKAYKGSIGLCSASLPYNILNLRYFDEITNVALNTTNTYNLVFSDGIENIYLNGTFPTNTTNNICTSINPTTKVIDFSVTGTFILSKTDYATRVITRLAGNEILTSNQYPTNESMYLIGIDNSTTITFTWRTPFYDYINAQMLIYTCDANNSITLKDTVNINNGVAVSNLELLSQPYYYQVLYNGVIYEDTATFSSCHTENNQAVTYLIDLFDINLDPVIGLYLVDCGLEEVTPNNVKMQWTSNPYSSSDITACLVGKRLMPSGYVEIFRNCTSAPSGSFIRSIPVNSYSYVVSGEISQNGKTRGCTNEINFFTESNTSKDFGIDGIFAIVLLLMAMLLMFSGTGIGQLFGIGIGIVVVYLLGLLSMPITSIIGIIIFLIIIAVVGRYSKRN